MDYIIEGKTDCEKTPSEKQLDMDFEEEAHQISELSKKDLSEFKAGTIFDSDDYGQIFGTEYKWDFPYILNPEKYRKIVKSGMSDRSLESVKFSAEVIKQEKGLHYSIFMYTTLFEFGSEGSHNDYAQGDCETLDEFIEKVKSILGCITGINETAAKSIMVENYRQIRILERWNDLIMSELDF